MCSDMYETEKLSDELVARMAADRLEGRHEFADPGNALRRLPLPGEVNNIWRSPYVRDIDTIMHCPFYNRYADKTQVFSFYKNDDISHRGLHVQLVSRIARTIGGALGLNNDLIEAIALGHDIGHTPFGHAGEKLLDRLYCANTGRHFAHNIQSVRVLDKIFPYNLSLQTLNGIAAHNGEYEQDEYRPEPLSGFEEYDEQIEACYRDPDNVLKLVPCTLEGCVVRLSDIIAYLGRDRQDAMRANRISAGRFSAGDDEYDGIVNNFVINIIESSYGHGYIAMDKRHFELLSTAKKENYLYIYGDENVREQVDDTVEPMMARLYDRIITDLRQGNFSAPVFTHHINYINMSEIRRDHPYEDESADDICVDYIASMTDDYFVDYYNYVFPDDPVDIKYIGYFDN